MQNTWFSIQVLIRQQRLEQGLQTTIDHLNATHIPEGIVICLETMAGKGSEVGYQSEHLAYILAHLNQKDSYGVCMDTCHMHDADMTCPILMTY